MTKLLLSPIAAGLTNDEYSDVAHAMSGVPGKWCVQRDTDDRGCMSLSILPVEDDDENGLSFLIWRQDRWLWLVCAIGEDCVAQGVYDNVDSALARIRTTIVNDVAMRCQLDAVQAGIKA